MEKNIKDFLIKIVKNCEDKNIVDEANKLLEEDFKEEVINNFYLSVENSSIAEAIEEKDKAKFIKSIYYWDEHNFLNDNFDKIGLIIDILKEYIDEHPSKKEEK